MTCGTLANDNANSRLNCGIGQTDTDTTFYVTGIQLELGSKATPLESRNIQEELDDCYRFFYNFKSSESSGEIDNVFSNVFFWSGNWQGYVKFPVEMRKIPSMTRSALDTFNLHQAGVFTRTPSSLNVGDAGTQGARISGGMTFTGTNGTGGQLTADNTDTAFMKFNAEF